MGRVVLGYLEKLDTKATLESIELAEVAGSEKVTYVLEATAEKMAQSLQENHDVYVPSTLVQTIDQNEKRLYVYFDLENYSFYQQAKELIQQESKPKGVLRYRRMVKQNEGDSLLVEDLYVLSGLLGDIESVKVKRTDQTVIPAHTIVMLNFGGGTMAHIEYTISDQERIELEWSGMRHIIEFNSDELKMIQRSDQTSQPLVYPVDAILETAHLVNQEVIDRLDELSKVLSGGEEK